MGKLHTLKRAIKRNPRKWEKACGAEFEKSKGGWFPAGYWLYRVAPYKKYIESIIAEIKESEHKPPM